MGRSFLLGRAEIDQHGHVIPAPHEDVRGLDVPMHDSGLMNLPQSLQQRDCDLQQIRFCEGASLQLALPQHLRQRKTVLILHDQIGGSVGLEELHAGDDARVVPELD